MATSVYDLAIRLDMTAAGFTSTAGTVMAAMKAMERQAVATGSAVNKMGLLAGGALTGIGVVGVLAMKDWISAAAQMQESLKQVGLVAAGTQAQLDALKRQSFTVAGHTQFSAPDILQMEQIMGRGGFRDLSNKLTPRQVIGQAIDQFARAAEILDHIQGTPYQDTVKALTQQAHMFATYSGDALARNVAYATGASLVSHMSPTQQITALRYLTPAVRSGQLSSLDALTMAVVANQSGLTAGGRAASGLGTFLRELAPNGSRVHDTALAQLEHYGGGDFYRNGRFVGLLPALQIYNRFLEATKTNIPLQTEIAKNAVLVQGMQVGAVLGSDTSIQQYANVHRQLAQDTPQHMAWMQGQLNQTTLGQLKTLRTDLHSIAAMLGDALIPAFAGLVGHLKDAAEWFMSLNPAVIKFVAGATAVVTVVGLIAGPLILIVSAAGALSGLLGLVAGGFTALGTAIWLAAAGTLGLDLALSPILIGIGAVALAVGAAILIFKNWSTISGVVGNLFGWMTGRLHDFLVMIGLAKNTDQPSYTPHADTSVPGGGAGSTGTVTYQGQTGHWVVGWHGARHFIPDAHQPAKHTPPRRAPGKGGMGGGGAYFAPGAIVVNAAPHHNEETIAQKVMEKMSAQFGAENKWQANDLYGGTDLSPLGIG